MRLSAYVDCFSGASGDMLLGALLDAGLSVDALRAGLASLPIDGWQIAAEPAEQHGLRGTRARVTVASVDQPHRHLAEVLRIIGGAALPERVADNAARVF